MKLKQYLVALLVLEFLQMPLQGFVLMVHPILFAPAPISQEVKFLSMRLLRIGKLLNQLSILELQEILLVPLGLQLLPKRLLIADLVVTEHWCTFVFSSS
jgi:hypothetical protein